MRITDPNMPLPLAPTSAGKSDVKPTSTSATNTPATSTPATSASVASSGTLLKSDAFENRTLSGNTGIMPPALPDVSSLVALWGLDQAKGSITGDQMATAIETGVGDADGKAASEEFRMFADWAQRNQARLSPEAKQVMDIYKKYADGAHLKGQGGLPEADFRKMIKEMKDVRDLSATAALGGLDQAQGPITGDQMAEAIRKGVEDADGKGASDEYKQFSEWAQKNDKRLSPEAKQVLDIYKKHAETAQAKGQSGIPDSDFRQMVKEMDAVQDASVAAVLNELDQAKGPINGDQMAAAISKGVADADGKGASDEYKQIADWAKKNESRLSPEAKQVLDIYKKHSEAAQAKGQSGIANSDFQAMVKEMDSVQDVSAKEALAELDKAQGPINGDQLAAAIRKGVEDGDGKGSTDEYKQFADWAQKNESRLSPEAKEVLGIYKKYAESAQAQGQSGLPTGQFQAMVKEMDAVQDVSVKTALAELDKAQGPVNGDQLAAAIRKGISDADGKGATDEYKQFADWAKKNEKRLSPEAKEVLGIYEKYAKASQAKGQSGIPDADYRKMVKEMNSVQDVSAKNALAGLDKAQGPINGDQLAAAIAKGIGDHDGKSATDEYKQFADWAKKNEKRLSPEAKQVLGIYEKYAKAAQAKGQSGMSDKDYRKMVKEMNAVRDDSATQALANLSHVRGHVSGRQMLNAIRKGVGDLDGKSATDEFKQFADWAKTHGNKLSPEAKKIMATYEKYAKAAQAHGDSGIALQDYRKMLREMTHALRPQPITLMARTFAG